MPRVATARVALEAQTHGSGPRAIFLGGTGADLRKAPSIFNTPLGERCEVLAFDARGCGRSEKPDTQPTMADFADDAVALMDAFGWGRAHVIGYSFGGMVAQHVAIRHPARVERLVLAATSPGGAGGSSFPLHTLAGLSPREMALRMLPIMDTRITEDMLVDPDLALEERIRLMIAYNSLFMDEPGAREGKARQLAARARHDCWNDLPGVSHETLVCGGLHDAQAPRDAVKALAQRLPNATLRWYAGGHAFSIECPEFWDDVAEFVSGG
jgi:3-oxoadipate enol-lactonase